MGKKLAIIHNVAVNGGDQLLLDSVIYLEKKYNYSVELISTNTSLSIPFLGKKGVLSNTIYTNSIFVSRFARTFRTLINIVSPIIDYFVLEQRKIKNLIDKCDYILLSPGGYIHEYYGFDNITSLIEYIKKKYNKKVILFGQSVGPFDEYPEKAKKLLKLVDKIVLREAISYEYVEKLGEEFKDKAIVTTDVAFGFHKLDKDSSFKRNKVILNFRELVHNSSVDVVERGVEILHFILEKGFNVEFVSTCQGVPEYRDDSIVHEKIVLSYSKKYGKDRIQNIVINKGRFKPDDLIQYINRYADYVIAMRMHMSISSILARTPVINIGYEPKTEGVFTTVCLESFVSSIFYDNKKVIASIDWLFSSDYKKLVDKIIESENIQSSLIEQSFEVLR